MRETEHDTTFKTSFLTVNSRINPSIVLVMAEYPNTVGEKIYNVQIIGKWICKALSPWHDLIISPPMYNNPSKLCRAFFKNVFSLIIYIPAFLKKRNTKLLFIKLKRQSIYPSIYIVYIYSVYIYIVYI